MKKCLMLSLAAVLALAVGACGGGNGTECGAGTVEQDGTCVPTCDDGEYWDGTECAAVPACADGTTFNATTGECEPDIDDCAPGTTLVNGQCVPECGDEEYWDGTECVAIPDCGQGTTFNEATGQCEPDITDCAPGTHLENGECVPDVVCGADTHPCNPEVDENCEEGECVPNHLPDPQVTEDDVVFSVPADEGETVSLGGVINAPVDEDDDGVADGDWDQFQFQATAGTYLDIWATSEGATLPAFALMGFDENDEVIYQRIGINTTGLVSEREVYLPYDAVYVLMVTDYNHMVASLFEQGTLPVGGPDFTYFVEVTNLGVPVPTDVESLPALEEGDLDDGGLAFYNVVGLTAGQLYNFTSYGQPLPDSPADLYPHLMLFNPDGVLVKETAPAPGESMSFWLSPAIGGDFLLVQDFDLAVGPNRDFAFEVFTEAMVDCGTEDCSAGDLEEGESETLTWELLSGDMFVAGVYLPEGATEAVDVTLLNSEADILMQDQATGDGNGAVFYYAENDTTVMVHLAGAEGAAVAEYSTDPLVIVTPLLEDGQSYTDLAVNELPAGTLPNSGIDHFVGTAGQMVFFTGFTTHNPNRDWVEPLEQIYTPNIEFMGPAYDVRSGIAELQPIFGYLPWDGHFLHLVWDSGDAADIVGASYDTAIDFVDSVDMGMPTEDSPANTSGQSLDADVGFAVYTFTATASTTTEIIVTPDDGTTIQPEVWVMNFGEVFCFFSCDWYPDPELYNLGATSGATAEAEGEPADTIYVSPYDGLSVIMVSDAGGNAGAGDTFSVDINVLPPPENDTCDNAADIVLEQGVFEQQVDTNLYSNTIDLSSDGCTGWASSAGPDAFWSIELAEGDMIFASMSPVDSFDASIYMITDCADPDGSCVAGDDSGNPEEFTYTVPQGGAGTYIIATDGYSASSGGLFDFTVEVTAAP
jgi:hypothetical protein